MSGVGRHEECPLATSRLCTPRCKWYNDETGNCMLIDAILAIKIRLEKIQKTLEKEGRRVE